MGRNSSGYDYEETDPRHKFDRRTGTARRDAFGNLREGEFNSSGEPIGHPESHNIPMSPSGVTPQADWDRMFRGGGVATAPAPATGTGTALRTMRAQRAAPEGDQAGAAFLREHGQGGGDSSPDANYLREMGESGPAPVQQPAAVAPAAMSPTETAWHRAFGPEWAVKPGEAPDATAARRRSILQAHVAASGPQKVGTVVDTGTSAFNGRGERQVSGNYAGLPQSGTTGVEYDPRHDATLTKTNIGGGVEQNGSVNKYGLGQVRWVPTAVGATANAESGKQKAEMPAPKAATPAPPVAAATPDVFKPVPAMPQQVPTQAFDREFLNPTRPQQQVEVNTPGLRSMAQHRLAFEASNKAVMDGAQKPDRGIVTNANPANAWSELQNKIRENSMRLAPAKKATPLTKNGTVAAFKRAQSVY